MIRQHKFVIVMENTFTFKMKMECDHWDGTVALCVLFQLQKTPNLSSFYNHEELETKMSL